MADSKIQEMTDEDTLHNMLSETEDFDKRKLIRQRLRAIREEKAVEWEKSRQERETNRGDDAVTAKLKQAAATKQKKLDGYAQRAADKDTGPAKPSAIQQRHAAADLEKQRRIQQITEVGSAMTHICHSGADIIASAEKQARTRGEGTVKESTETTTGPGGKTVTTTRTSTHKTKDGEGSTVTQTKNVTQVGDIGGTSYSVRKTPAKSGAGGARAAFQAMDKTATPPGGAGRANVTGGGRGGGRGVGVQRSPSAIKQMLLEWCKSMTKEYENVNITNFSSSWNDGMAFCALIHHFCPETFDFDRLNPKNRRANFKLAFEVAEKEADISPLLEVDDMVRFKNPDWKCVFCYIQGFYRRFGMQAKAPPKPAESPASAEENKENPFK